MYVQTPQGEYQITFHHTGPNQVGQRVTICTLKPSGVFPPPVWQAPSYTAFAICHEKDQFSKEKGRKLALKRALELGWPGPEGREVRRKFWQAYLNRNQPKPVPEPLSSYQPQGFYRAAPHPGRVWWLDVSHSGA